MKLIDELASVRSELGNLEAVETTGGQFISRDEVLARLRILIDAHVFKDWNPDDLSAMY